MSCIKVDRLTPHRPTGVAGVSASIQAGTLRRRLALSYQACAVAKEAVHTLNVYPTSNLIFCQHSSVGAFTQIYPPKTLRRQ